MAHSLYMCLVRAGLVMLFFSGTTGADAQSDSISAGSFSFSPQAGFITPHREQMEHLITGHSFGGILSWMHHADGRKLWHHLYRKPGSGAFAFFLSTGNPDQLGYQIGVGYCIRLPLMRAPDITARFSHAIELGLGPGIATRAWDLETNHQANVIGSRLNAAILVAWSARIMHIERFSCRAGVRIIHLSNGAFQVPNLGTNNIALFLSGELDSRVRRRTTEWKAPGTRPRPSHLTLSLSGGLQQVPPPLSPKFGVTALSLSYHRRYSWKAAWNGGLDLFWKPSLLRLFEQRDGQRPAAGHALQAGAAIGYSLFFDRMELRLQQGIYLMDRWKDTGRLYHRAGLRYSISPHFFAHLMLKTHFAKADHAEAGFGYQF